jgi:hypothetical protein
MFYRVRSPVAPPPVGALPFNSSVLVKQLDNDKLLLEHMGYLMQDQLSRLRAEEIKLSKMTTSQPPPDSEAVLDLIFISCFFVVDDFSNETNQFIKMSPKLF